MRTRIDAPAAAAPARRAMTEIGNAAAGAHDVVHGRQIVSAVSPVPSM